MIKSKYMFSEAKAKAKDTTSEAKAKDLAPKAKAKDMTSCPRGQGHGLEDSISEHSITIPPRKDKNLLYLCNERLSASP